MNALATQSSFALVADAFAEAGLDARTAGHAGAWVISRPEDGAQEFHADLRHPWLGLSLTLPADRDRSFMDVLSLNASLSGAARLSTSADGNVWVRADVCLSDSNDSLLEQIESAVAALLDGARRYVNPANESGDPDRPAHEGGAFAPVVEALSEAGRDVQLDDLGCRVTIHAAGRPHRAVLQLHPDATGSAHVDLASIDGAHGLAHEAAALLLLRAGNGVRMVSPQARTAGGQTALFIAGRFALSRATTDAVHLVNALSLAIDSCGEEVRAMAACEELARVYLATQGFRSDRAHPRATGPDQNVANQ